MASVCLPWSRGPVVPVVLCLLWRFGWRFRDLALRSATYSYKYNTRRFFIFVVMVVVKSLLVSSKEFVGPLANWQKIPVNGTNDGACGTTRRFVIWLLWHRGPVVPVVPFGAVVAVVPWSRGSRCSFVFCSVLVGASAISHFAQPLVPINKIRDASLFLWLWLL